MKAICSRRPTLEAPVREEIDYYSTEQLRDLYHGATSGLIRLRNANISREEIQAEIRWRLSRESRRFWITLIVAVVGTLAAVIAAVEGYKPLVSAEEPLQRAAFVGCPSDGQQGEMAPLERPEEGTDIPGIPRNSGLSLYQARGTPAVLAPRGWYCAGLEGSNGGTLVVTPERHKPQDFFFGKTTLIGPAIEASFSLGGTSGRFEVAETAARLFPKAAAFVQSVLAEGLVDKITFQFRPYANDRLTYRGDFAVEYVTPANSDGEGTRSFLGKSARPIAGLVVMEQGGDHDMLRIAVRLPASESQLISAILGNLENRPNFQ